MALVPPPRVGAAAQGEAVSAGRVARQVRVKTGADWLLLREDMLLMTTYHTNFVFGVQR